MATEDLRSMLDRMRGIRLEKLTESGGRTRSQLNALPSGLLTVFLKIAAAREGCQDVMDLLKSGPDHAAEARLRRRASMAKVA